MSEAITFTLAGTPGWYYRFGSMHRLIWIPLFAATACGRPATEKECEHIVERVVELELKEAAIVDSNDVADRVKTTKEAFHKRAMEQCVGKRVTDDALRCVQQAKTASEIVDQCFD